MFPAPQTTAMGEKNHFHRPEIDGLRCLAILPVVLFHANLGCAGGYIGVDVFFVISGYLISKILFLELDRGTFSLAGFWHRRFRRIIPALLEVCVLVYLTSWLLLPGDEMTALGGQLMAVLTGIANFKMLRLTNGYWAQRADAVLMLHTWSLAVEEQFYLLMPVLLAVFYQRNRTATMWLLGGLAAVSFAICLYWSHGGYAGNFYLLSSRSWELLLGCLGAYFDKETARLPQLARSFAVIAGVAMILISAFGYSGDAQWPNVKSSVPTLGAFLILIAPAVGQKKTWPLAILSWAPVRFIGLISYSIYLWPTN